MTPSGWQRTGVLGPLLPLALALVLLPAGPAAAHANLVSSEPTNGGQMAASPDALVLRYSEGVQRARVGVVDAAKRPVDRSEAAVDPQDRRTVSVALTDLVDGLYTATWQVLSEDGHTTSGALFFVVGQTVPTREELLALFARSDEGRKPPGVRPHEPPTRGVLFLALVTLVGLPTTLVVAVRPVLRRRDVPDEALFPRARRLLLVACALVTVTATVLAVGQMAGAYGSFSLGNVGSFLQTISGRAWLVRVGLAGGLALVLTLAERPG
ncbi:MAG: copper resistance CopC family protein, partial [Actinomycetota bacterium]